MARCFLPVKKDKRVKTWIETNDISTTTNYTTTGTVTGGHLKDTSLTPTRVPIVGTGGQLADDSDLTFSGSRLTATDLTSTNAPIVSSLSAGRVVFAGASKELVDDSDLTFSGDKLSTTKILSTQVQTPEIKTDLTTPTDLTITTGSAKTLVIATPVYDDIIIQALNLRPSGTTPPTFEVFQDSIYGVSFKNAQTDIVYGSFEIPHTYKEGTALEVHLHWSPSSTNTGDCVFNMAYSIAENGGTFGTEAQLTFTQAGSGTINKHQYVSANVNITGAITIGTIVCFALSRPTGDAFSGNAFLHSIGVHYQIDTMGSRSISAK